MGSVNGAGQTLASLVRALGPASGGAPVRRPPLLAGARPLRRSPLRPLARAGAAWGASLGLGPPAGQFLPFAAVAAALVATQLLYRRVDLPGV
jgi:hypothetical protein